MSRKDAAEKVAKLRRLADDPRTPRPEAENARRRADKIAADHQLGERELGEGRMSAAFDELVEQIEKIVVKHKSTTNSFFGAESAIRDVLGRIRAMPDVDKAARLQQIVTVTRTASFIVGRHPLVAEAKAVVDAALKNHDVKI